MLSMTTLKLHPLATNTDLFHLENILELQVSDKFFCYYLSHCIALVSKEKDSIIISI